jgi:glycosyltransferase involved in cell wall biosynthesis
MTKTSPLVTVLLPVQNGASTLSNAIQSILNQSYSHWELLILDDGSNDDTLQIAQCFSDARIQIVHDGQHRGIVARLNQGISLARGAYIARMDADDVSHPQRLEKQVAFLEGNSNVDLVGSAIRLMLPNNASKVRTFPLNHAEIVAQPWKKTLSMAHPTWCGRVAWFRQWQYRDFWRNEDQELLLRASETSVYANLPDVLLDYTVHQSLRQSLAARGGWMKVLWVYYALRSRVGEWLKGTLWVVAKTGKDVLDWVSVKYFSRGFFDTFWQK